MSKFTDKAPLIDKENKRNESEDSKPGFVCSVSAIEFIDFEDGQSYTKNLELTNAALSRNSFRSLSVEDKYKDYFEIAHERVGYVAPGIGVPFKITFFPKQRMNVSTFLTIDSELGCSTVPIHCTYKRTKLRLETVDVRLPDTILGEEGYAVLKMTNEGGLASRFEVVVPSRSNRLRANSKNLNNSFNSSMSIAGMNHQFSGKSLHSGVASGSLEGHPPDESQLYFERNILHKQLFVSPPRSIDGYSTAEISFTFRPVGDAYERTGQLVLKFENSIDQPDILIHVHLHALSLPVYLQRKEIDFGICLFDTLYREKVVVRNDSAKTAKLEIRGPPELLRYFIFSPLFSYAQPNSEFTFWVKTKLDDHFLTECERYVDKDLKQIRGEFELYSSAQLAVLKFTISMKYTEESLEFHSKLDFGMMYKNTAKSLKWPIKNASSLPQRVHFNSLPSHLRIEPDISPWTLLPGEQMTFDIICKGLNVGNEHGRITAKVLVGEEKAREIEVAYSVAVFESPIELSTYRLDFKTAQEDETVSHQIRLKNISAKTLRFELAPPPAELSGLRFSPATGLLESQKSVNVFVEFHGLFRTVDFDICSKLSGPDEKGDSLKASLEENEAKVKELTSNLEAGIASKSLAKGDKERMEEQRLYFIEKSRQLTEELRVYENERRAAFDINGALLKLGGFIKNYYWDDPAKKLQTFKWLIPVTFKGENEPDAYSSSTFIEISTAVKNQILFVDRKVIDFGDVVIGTRRIEQFTLRNGSERPMNLKMDVTSLFSGFEFLGCLKEIPPGASKTFNVAFEPQDECVSTETIIFFDTNSVAITLKGRGFEPDVEIEGGSLLADLGNVIVGEEAERTLKLRNPTTFAVDFELFCNSVKTRNKNGRKAVFFSPFQGRLQAGETKMIKVTFQPSEASDDYIELLTIKVNKRLSKHKMLLKGSAFDRMGFAKHVFEFDETTLSEAEKRAKQDGCQLNYMLEEPSYLGERIFNLKIPRRAQKNDTQMPKQLQKLIVGCCKSSKQGIGSIDYEFVINQSEVSNLFKVSNGKGKLANGQTVEMIFELTDNAGLEDSSSANNKQKRGSEQQSSTNYSDFLPAEIAEIGRWIKLEGTLRIGSLSGKSDECTACKVIVEGYIDRIC